MAKDQVAGAKIDQNRLGDEQLLEIQKLTKNQDDGRGETSETLPVSATFINAFQKDNRETVSLEGKKIWDDYNNYFGARPDITLTVSRYANPFPGDTNNVKEQTVSKDSYEVVWQNNGEKEDEWSYTIKGITENELEKYAPNGMPWEYVVTEKLDKTNGYVASPSRVGEKSQIDDVITMNNLKNALNTQVPYSKSWVDAAGNLITAII